MNTKKLSILGGILAILIAIIVISDNLPSTRANSSKASFFPGLKITDCSKISITSNAKEVITLSKDNGIWTVSNGTDDQNSNATPSGTPFSKTTQSKNSNIKYEADSAAVAIVLEKLTSMKKNVIISNNKTKQGTFQVDSTKGTFVTIFNNDGEKISTFVIGKSGVTWDENYVRIASSNDVYSLPGSLKYTFHTELKRWRNKAIVKLGDDNLKMVTITSKEKGKVVLQQSQNSVEVAQWEITEPEKSEVNAEEVAKLIKNILTLKTYDWSKDNSLSDSAMGYLDPIITVNLITKSGKTETLTVGKSDEKSAKVYLKTLSSKQNYIVWDSDIQKLNKSFDELKKIEVKNDTTTTPSEK